MEDPRSRKSPHDLREILLVAVCAVLSGAGGWASVAQWGQIKLDWLRQFLPYENGVASHDTFGRVFALLDSAVFEQRFIGWMAAVCPALAGQAVSIDGKTVKRSKSSGQKAIHMVSAFAGGLGLTFSAIACRSSGSLISAILSSK